MILPVLLFVALGQPGEAWTPVVFNESAFGVTQAGLSSTGGTQPGTPILLSAEATWDGGSSRSEWYVVVENPVFSGRTFYCARADKLLAGVHVRYPAAGELYPREGVVTNDDPPRMCVAGRLVEWPN